MPSEIAQIQTFTLFGVRVVLESESREALEAVASAYDENDEPGPTGECVSIYVVMRSYKVNERQHCDGSHVDGTSLAMTGDGISISANASERRGSCDYPCDTVGSDAFAEMMNTLILYLVAQSGRIPIHASAIVIGDTAIVLAGKSGSGKSSLAFAADHAGLPVLSDDTIFVQTDPFVRIWALTKAIHLFEKDAPSDATGAMRLRSGRWKRALAVSAPRRFADRSVLCVLERGNAVKLERIDETDAITALTASPEPGYEFYGERPAAAVRALGTDGCWRLTLSADPGEAIALLQRKLTGNFHSRYLSLVNRIERDFAVSRWRSGDVDVWPFARMDLYLDMHRHATGEKRPRQRTLPLRIIGRSVRPLRNLWKSRRDLAHWVARPNPADAIVLGDGVSLDRVDGAWIDRFGEPVIAALENRGAKTLLMQRGDLSRLPWKRPTFAANLVEARGGLKSLFSSGTLDLPDHDRVLKFLAREGVSAPSLARATLARRTTEVAATASAFERILRAARPRIAFVVTYYAGLGHAFVLACRRLGILSVDVQHCPQDGLHKAYSWSSVPETGYTTLPAVFWNWTEAEAAAIRIWSDNLPARWHQSLHGGHTQLASFGGCASEKKFREVARGNFDREILVALQPIARHSVCWETLVDQIEAAPSSWRWWIRRHPSSRAHQDREFGRLLALRKPNVMIEEASSLPLPVLLRHMSVVISLASGTAAEAEMFGVPAFFLGSEALGPFASLVRRGGAKLVDVRDVNSEIARLPIAVGRQPVPQPSIDSGLEQIEQIAQAYALLCRENGMTV